MRGFRMNNLRNYLKQICNTRKLLQFELNYRFLFCFIRSTTSLWTAKHSRTACNNTIWTLYSLDRRLCILFRFYINLLRWKVNAVSSKRLKGFVTYLFWRLTHKDWIFGPLKTENKITEMGSDHTCDWTNTGWRKQTLIKELVRNGTTQWQIEERK